MSDQRMFNYGKFEFIGKLGQGKELVTDLNASKSGKSDWFKKKLNISIKAGTNNQFLAMEQMHNPKFKSKVKLYDKDGEEFEVAATETTNPEVIAKARDLGKTVIDLEQDQDKKSERISLFFKRKNHENKEEKTEDDIQKIAEYTNQINELSDNLVEFVTMNDAIDYLKTVVDTLKDVKVKATGNIKCNYYNGSTRFEYIPSRIEIVSNDTQDKLECTFDIFFDKDACDDNIKDQRLIANCYVGEYIKKQPKLFPIQIVLDYTKIDLQNEEHVKLLEFMKKTFKAPKKNMFYKMSVVASVINGSQVVEWDETCLTADQKMMVDLGLSQAIEFKPRGNTYGSKITELRLLKPDLKSCEFETEAFEVDELSTFLSSDDSDKKVEDVKDSPKAEEPKKEEKKSESTEDLMAALFGA